MGKGKASRYLSEAFWLSIELTCPSFLQPFDRFPKILHFLCISLHRNNLLSVVPGAGRYAVIFYIKLQSGLKRFDRFRFSALCFVELANRCQRFGFFPSILPGAR